MSNAQFGMSKKESIFDQYIGKYVIIYPIYGSTFAGKLIEVKDGFAILNPHQSAYIDKEKGLIRKICKANAIINLTNMIAIEPTTKKSLEAACEYSNLQIQKQNNLKSQ